MPQKAICASALGIGCSTPATVLATPLPTPGVARGRQVGVELDVLVLVEIELASPRGPRTARRRGPLRQLQLAERLGRHWQVVGADQRRVEIVESRLGDLRAVERQIVRRVGAVGSLAEQAEIVLVALQGARPRLQQRVGGLLGVFPLQEACVLHQGLQRDLVGLAQQGELLALALFDRREQRRAERADFAGEFQRLLHQIGRAHRPERLVEAGDHAGDVDPRRRRLDQHARIERRVEQRQLLEDALDVLAVADLEQPVGDGVPIGEQRLVLRDAEIERAADAEQRPAHVHAVAGLARRRQRG